MNDKHLTFAASAGQRAVVIGAAIAFSLAAALATPASAQSITDRFKSLFGGGSSSEPSQGSTVTSPAQESDLTCPEVTVRAGASTYAVGLPGKPASGGDVRYQATIGRMARSCALSDGMIKAKIGIQGRVIAGPAGAPSSVDVPLRIAVVQEGIEPKTVFTQVYLTQVSMPTDGTAPFTLVAEDVAYPVPPGNANDAYVFYIGFDPLALKPEPARKTRR
uniref:Uncharacterized protein n=1 Tax=Rhodopseudomonas palustris (strain BisA53) TaxID=316055 RepID=Q07HA3_RHOP5